MAGVGTDDCNIVLDWRNSNFNILLEFSYQIFP
jgi:hypothetical protein